MSDIVYFDKYDVSGAYHWAECDRRLANWKRYNPALDARYSITAQKIARLEMPGNLLDVGCGDGMLMARVAPFMKEVKGVDSEARAICLAKEKLAALRNCEALHTACYDLPFASNTFDIVVSADVIEHLKEPFHHLSEIQRVVKQNGALVLTTPKWRPDRKWDQRHEKEYRAEELHNLLSGFFTAVEMNFFWPLNWSRFYATKVGWRLTKLISATVWNPFVQCSTTHPDRFGQLLAVCRQPRS